MCPFYWRPPVSAKQARFCPPLTTELLSPDPDIVLLSIFLLKKNTRLCLPRESGFSKHRSPSFVVVRMGPPLVSFTPDHWANREPGGPFCSANPPQQLRPVTVYSGQASQLAWSHRGTFIQIAVMARGTDPGASRSY